MLLLGLLTSVLSYTLARNFRRKKVSFFIRAFLFWVDFVGLTRTLDNNRFEEDAKFLRQVPGNDQKDSIILLPAFCLLEGKFDPLQPLQPTQQSHLAHKGIHRATFFQIKVILYIGVTAFGCTLLYILSSIAKNAKHRGETGDKHHKAASTEKGKWSKLIALLWRLFKLTSWVICTIFIIWNCLAISRLRSWVNGSVWLQRENGANPERTIQSIGQLTPLVALGAIALTFTNSLGEQISKWKQTADDNYIQLQDGTHQWKTNGSV